MTPHPQSTATELRESAAWQALAAAEDRPAWREACQTIAARLRAGWQAAVQPDLPDESANARRNLQPQQAAVLRGRIYNRRKQKVGGQLPKGVDQNDPALSTAQAVAAETGVSEGTIKRDGKLAQEVDADPQLRKALPHHLFAKMRAAVKSANDS